MPKPESLEFSTSSPTRVGDIDDLVQSSITGDAEGGEDALKRDIFQKSTISNALELLE